MDFDLAWCPACDRQIQPKRHTVSVPVPTRTQPPPPPPSSPRKPKTNVRQKAGLVNGTGRVRPNGTIKSTSPPPVVMKQRIVIDQGPAPLYCSDECQFADINSQRRSAPFDPAREEPSGTIPTQRKKTFTTAPSETDSSDSDSVASPPAPAAPMTSMEKYAAIHNFPPMPPVPVFEDPEPEFEYSTPEYTSGIMMAGRRLNSLRPSPAKPHQGRYRPAQEPRKPIPGWTDGSNEWRKALYSVAPSPKFPTDFGRPASAHAPTRPRPARASSSSCISSISLSQSASDADSFHAASEQMISRFSENFTRRSESRASLYVGGGSPSSHTPSTLGSSSSLPTSPRRERPLVHAAAEGKLLVPNVKMRVHSGSSASLSSSWTSSAAGSSNSRRSARSPLSMTSDSDEDTERCASDNFVMNPITAMRPVETTRSWSYDNVKTYPLMPMPARKVKKLETRVVDGEERVVEVEVEQKPQRLFLFAPTRVSTP